MAGQTEPQASGRPRQEPLKTAVNRAYYAMFHALCQNNADALVSRSNDRTTSLAWTRTYRSLNHRQAKNRLTRGRSEISGPARSFAATFAALQEQRLAADYVPHSRFAKKARCFQTPFGISPAGTPTQFGRAMDELGIQMIFALSPQAKGRVERTAGTFQDRLVTELQLSGASNIGEANRVLEQFLPRFNQRFRVPAQYPDPAFRPVDP